MSGGKFSLGGMVGGFARWGMPLLYSLVIIGAMGASFALHMRRDGVFSCPADQYGGDHYMGMCDSPAYGDFDHGAVWYGLEPRVAANAAKADVLVLGNSRSAFGFSAPAIGAWAAKNDVDFYVFGFSHFENMTFELPLLKRIQPTAKVYIVNVDGFFTDVGTGPGLDVMNNAGTQTRYKAKQAWQQAHQTLCGAVPKLCGDRIAFYRQRDTGQWIHTGSMGASPSENDTIIPADADAAARAKPFAEKFLAEIGVRRECVILTYIPPKESERATAELIAQSVGLQLISPDVPGLATFDGSHLDADSAQKWLTAFMEAAEPRLKACLADGAQPTASVSATGSR